MKKVFIILFLLIGVFMVIKYTMGIPLSKDISYSDIDFYNGNINTDWRTLSTNSIVNSKPKIIFNNGKNYRPGVSKDEIFQSEDKKYNIKIVGTYVEILDENNNFLFKFNKSSNNNLPVIYSKDKYLIVIVDSVYGSNVTNIIVYKTDKKQVYDLSLNLDKYKKKENSLLSFGEFGVEKTRELDIANDVIYMVVTDYNTKPFILSYDINTQIDKKYVNIQNLRCNIIDFVVKEDGVYWQESYVRSGLFSKTFLCKSYKKSLE